MVKNGNNSKKHKEIAQNVLLQKIRTGACLIGRERTGPFAFISLCFIIRTRKAPPKNSAARWWG
jgi:hypothetical protein